MTTRWGDPRDGCTMQFITMVIAFTAAPLLLLKLLRRRICVDAKKLGG